MTVIKSLAGQQALNDIITMLNTWDVAVAGFAKPKIESLWDETIVTFNDTDNYILLQIDQEKINPFSMMNGVAPYTYDWYHIVNFTLDFRSTKSDQFDVMLAYAMELFKNNLRLSSHVYTLPEIVNYDYTIRGIWRATIGIRLETMNPTKTI